MIRCQFENGNQALLRHVVVDIVLVEDGKVFLVKRSPEYTEGGKWAVIGGYVERDETILQAAKREALEESGYEVEIEKLLGIEDSPKRPGDDRQNISFYYLAKPVRKIQEPDKESTAVQWFPLGNLPPQAEFAFDHLDHIKNYLEKSGFNA